MHSKKSEIVLNNTAWVACKECTERHVGCHSTCTTYAAEHAEHERRRRASAELIRREKDYDDYVNRHFGATLRRRRWGR